MKYALLLLLAVCINTHAYTIGEIEETHLALMTAESAPRTHCSVDAPKIEVSNNIDFSDSYVGTFMFSTWDIEDTEDAKQRLGVETPSLVDYERYVTFGISQPDTSGLFGEGKETLSYGWKYARLLCEYNNNNVCVDENGNAVALDLYVGNVAEDFPRVTVGPVEPVEPVQVCSHSFEGTSKAQLLGLITQMENLVSNGDDAGKVLRSVADLYGKVEEVQHELSVMREIINGVETR